MAPTERKIPVFTVLKNNSILKNIFILDAPEEEEEYSQEEFEETLWIGRHPDCNIVLEHPSISRFHLRIYSTPFSLSLSVTDLSSVHGTWVCEKKIEPNVPVDLNEGDTLRLGGSSRIYRLHWVPLNVAYDLENPFVHPMDLSDQVDEKELEGDQSQTLEASKEIDSMLSEMKIISSLEELIPSAPLMNTDNAFYVSERVENCSVSEDGLEQNETSDLQLFNEDNQEGNAHDTPETFSAAGEPQMISLLESPDTTPLRSAQKTALSIWSRRGNCASVQVFTCKSQTVSTLENPETPPVRSAHKKSPSIWSRRGKSASVQIETGRVKGKRVGADTEIDSIPKDLCPWDLNDVEEIFTPDKENLTFDTPLIRSLKTIDQDNMNIESILKSESFSDDGDEIFTPDKENITPDALRSKSMKKIRVMEVLANKNSCRSSALKNVIGSNLHRENQELPVFNNENEVPESVPKYVSSSAEEDENKIFTPDEENITPDTLQFKSIKKVRKLEETKDNNSLNSTPLKNMIGSIRDGESHVLTSANNENQVPEVLLGQKRMNSTSSVGAKLMLQSFNPKGEEDEVPLQSLHVEPISKTTKDQGQNDPLRTRCKESISHPLTQPVRNNASKIDNTTRWTMVVDTASLLNKKSRQALTLLQGLKRTNLIVPSIVVRELDGIKRRSSFFKRTNEASTALQFIEDCIENSKWWIHVQSYAEEARTIAATPPATPLSCFSGEKRMFSPYGVILDTLSPTSDDHILECALFFRTFANGRLVLLSNDVTLKIKAMTEGLLCESAEQFREGLVNPFSDRFLWANSSPIGPSWSCMDDVVLQEKYCRGPLKNLSKSGNAVKGLKLILLHNSQYRNLSPISPMA